MKSNQAVNYQMLEKLFGEMDLSELVDEINHMREFLHKFSPFKENPVDFVKWVKNTQVSANDYNPNAVAPPEMKLLEHSIDHDGYTQPIVAWEKENEIEVIDGFHRHRVGKESKTVQQKVHGYLPIVAIKDDCQGRNDRIASTIRHNRARGKHKVESMSDIVLELKRRNWSPKKIGKELGMDQDEVLRLVQITGLAEMFTDKEFSEAWEVAEYTEEVEVIE
jgi:ParB-like chromosome segregation protein Spo0J